MKAPAPSAGPPPQAAETAAGEFQANSKHLKSCTPVSAALAYAESMAKATWEGCVLAESPRTIVVEGNHYFPPESVHEEYLRPSTETSVCPWKGKASYYNVEVDGKTNPGAAWFYPEPKEAAKEIKDHVAFWRGVKVER